MKITYTEDIKKDAMKELKKFAPTDIYMFYEFNKEVKTGTLRIQASKNYYNKDVTLNIERNFEVEYNTQFKKLVISRLEMNDVLLSMLLDNNITIDPYFKNLKDIKMGSTDCDYWMDTIVVKSKGKRIKHDEISFNNVQMIYNF